jgi:hypothetical protein
MTWLERPSELEQLQMALTRSLQGKHSPLVSLSLSLLEQQLKLAYQSGPVLSSSVLDMWTGFHVAMHFSLV